MDQKNVENFKLVDEVISMNKKFIKLESDVTVLKVDVAELKTDLKATRFEMHRMGVFQEEMNSDMKFMLEAMTGFIKKYDEFDKDVESEKEFEMRLDINEKVLKSHIRDKKIHTKN